MINNVVTRLGVRKVFVGHLDLEHPAVSHVGRLSSVGTYRTTRDNFFVGLTLDNTQPDTSDRSIIDTLDPVDTRDGETHGSSVGSSRTRHMFLRAFQSVSTWMVSDPILKLTSCQCPPHQPMLLFFLTKLSPL